MFAYGLLPATLAEAKARRGDSKDFSALAACPQKFIKTSSAGLEPTREIAPDF
jgi:hypothetical protein